LEVFMAAVVVGGTTLDLFATGVSVLPVGDGDEFTERSLAYLPTSPVASVGGNGANAAFALARLGCRVRLVTPVADDLYGRMLSNWLSRAGVRLHRLPARETSVNFVATDVTGRRVSFFCPVAGDANASLRELASVRFKRDDTLLLTGWPHLDDGVLRQWAERAHAVGARTALDIGPRLAGFRLDRLEPLLPVLDTVLANADEVSLLDPARPAAQTAALLAGRLASGVVVKDGSRGASFHCGTAAPIRVDAFPVPAMTATVGAGDVFNAGYLAAACDGAPAEERLRFAAATAALMLRSRAGPSTSPTLAEVTEFLSTREHPATGELSSTKEEFP
jgi:sugar/nucleoside kinase (ribokinase family)